MGCQVTGCERPFYGRGCCRLHYQRLMARGTTDDPRPTAEARFWPFVDKTATCWLWTGAQNGRGYGQFWDGSKKVYAHRFAYELLVGPIPDGLELDHVAALGCVNRHCVNPAHLEPVTHAVNTLRGGTIARRRSEQTHCIHGHPFDETNTCIAKDGTRYCRRCKADSEARRRRSAA